MDRISKLEGILSETTELLYALVDEFVETRNDAILEEVGRVITKINRIRATAEWCKTLSPDNNMLESKFTGGGGRSGGGGASGGW